jgi:uncharacterized protein (TIGR02284 family)
MKLMKNEKSIEVLNTLIEINNDRIEGYKMAYKQTEEEELKLLFSKLGRTSQKCKAELIAEVERLGGVPDQGVKTTRRFFRVWKDVKAALADKDRKSVLEACEYGEDATADIYNRAMINHPKDLNMEQQKMIGEQSRLLKSDLARIMELGNAVVEYAR